MSEAADYQEAIERIDKRLRQSHEAGLGPGASLALTTADGLLTTRTYGVRNIDTGEPVTDDTLFQIGSITKHFTAIACLRLHEDRILDLHAPVTEVLDWFEVPSQFDTPLTIHHLLTHTGGLVMMNDCCPSSWWQAWALRDTQLGFEPGSKFSYSNVGYNVLQCILETCTGKRFGDVLRDLIFDPLGMHDSWGEVRTDQLARLARGHKYSLYDDRPVCVPDRQAVVNWYEMSAGCASVVTTATDLARFLRMLLRRGTADDGTRILSAETYEAMIRPYAAMDGFFQGTTQGYGVLIETSEDTGGTPRIIGGGENLGYEAAMYGDFAAQVGVVLFNNSFDVRWNDVKYAMSVLLAASVAEPLPALPEATACTHKHIGDSAVEYVGTYHGTKGSLSIRAEDGTVVLSAYGTSTALEPIYTDHFVAPHPAFEHAMLSFGRNDAGDVVAAYSLGDEYRNERYEGLAKTSYPSEWDAYIGKYRSFGTLVTNLRIFVRSGTLFRQAFGGYVDQPLEDLGDGRFRVGDETSPEILRFDCMAGSKTLRCRTAGGAFYRVSEL